VKQRLSTTALNNILMNLGLPYWKGQRKVSEFH